MKKLNLNQMHKLEKNVAFESREYFEKKISKMSSLQKESLFLRACKLGRLPLIKLFVENGVEPSIRDNLGIHQARGDDVREYLASQKHVLNKLIKNKETRLYPVVMNDLFL